MSDVQVNNSPGGNAPQPVETGGGGSGAAWAIVVIVLLAIVAWFVFGRGITRGDGEKDINANVKIETPAAPSGGGGATKAP